MGGFSRFASRKAKSAQPSFVQPPNSDLGNQANNESPSASTEEAREERVDGSKSNDWSCDDTAGFDDSAFLPGTRAASTNASFSPGLDTFDTMPNMEVREFAEEPSLDLFSISTKDHVEDNTSGRSEVVEGGNCKNIGELPCPPTTPKPQNAEIATEAEEKERDTKEGLLDSRVELSVTAQVLPTAKTRKVDVSKSRSAGIIGRDAAPYKSCTHVEATKGSTGKPKVGFAFLPNKYAGITSSKGQHYGLSTNLHQSIPSTRTLGHGQEKRNKTARKLDNGNNDSCIFARSQQPPAQQRASLLETTKQTCDRANAFGHISDSGIGPSGSKTASLVNSENSMILPQVVQMPNKIATATSSQGSSSDTAQHKRANSTHAPIQEKKKPLHDDGSMNKKLPRWDDASYADREELAKTPAARKPKEIPNKVTPDSAPLTDSEIPRSSSPSFEDMYGKFQLDLRELADTNHRNETALLGMEVALATSYNDTLYEQTDLLQVLERSYDTLQELDTIIEDLK